MANTSLSEAETLKKMMDKLTNFMEGQTRMVQSLMSNVQDLTERVARCELSQDERFSTRLDQLSDMPTPQRSHQFVAASTRENPPVTRPAEPEANLGALINWDLELDDLTNAAKANNSTNQAKASRTQSTPPDNCRSQPAPSTRSESRLLPAIMPHSTPRAPPPVRFQDTFLLDGPIPEHMQNTPVLTPAQVKVAPQYYSGKHPWRLYRRHFEALARLGGWSDEVKALYLVTFLQGTALSFYDTLSDAVRASYEKLDAAFDSRFSNRFQKTVAHIKLRGCVQGPRESLIEFATKVQEYAGLAFEDDPERTRESVALAQFIDGLADADLQQRVRDSWPETLEEALARAEQTEAGREASRICRRGLRVATTEVQHPSTSRQAPVRNRERTRPAASGPPPARAAQTVTERGIKGRVRKEISDSLLGMTTERTFLFIATR